MRSCIYSGHVAHRRQTPLVHAFRYSLRWLYLDLDELDRVRQQFRLLSAWPWGPLCFRETDHGVAAGVRLKTAILERLAASVSPTEVERIDLLTPLRQFGHYFSPVCLYYCWRPGGQELAAVVAEVSNTPWRERHWYVLAPLRDLSSPRSPRDAGGGEGQRRYAFEHNKDFHVSPFMDLQMRYRWRLRAPAERLSVSIDILSSSAPFFTAALQLQRRPLTRAGLASMLLRYPFTSWQILAAIYFEAFRLWMHKAPYYPHPPAAISCGSPDRTRPR